MNRLGKRLARMWHLARQAKAEYGKGLIAQALDILRLRFGPGRLGASEYYYYGICDDRRYSFAEKQEFVGWRGNARIDAILNDDDWRAVADDKLLFAHLMDGLGLPRPQIHAVYSPIGRGNGNAHRLTTIANALDFLRGAAPYPLFIKPIVGSYGRGVLACTGYQADGDALILANGERRKLADLAADFAFAPYHGFLFQELLEPHPEIARICGPRLSTVRVIMLMVDGQPRLFRALWRGPTGRSMNDNFSAGVTGNLCAAIDPETGTLGPVYVGAAKIAEAVPRHPDTGLSFEDFIVPEWPAVIRMCRTAAHAVPRLRLQHWDIALSADGLKILELNVSGGCFATQYVHAGGIFDDTMQRAIAQAVRQQKEEIAQIRSRRH